MLYYCCLSESAEEVDAVGPVACFGWRSLGEDSSLVALGSPGTRAPISSSDLSQGKASRTFDVKGQLTLCRSNKLCLICSVPHNEMSVCTVYRDDTRITKTEKCGNLMKKHALHAV